MTRRRARRCDARRWRPSAPASRHRSSSGYAADVGAQVGPLVPVVVARARHAARHAGHARGRAPRVLARAPRAASASCRRGALQRRARPSGYADARRALARATTSARRSSALPRPAPSGAARGRRRAARRGPGRRRRHDRVELLRPGALVDVLVTSERGRGVAAHLSALQRVELVELRAGRAATRRGERGGADATATLRVTLRQAVLLTAAQNFARELRARSAAGGRRPAARPDRLSAAGPRP